MSNYFTSQFAKRYKLEAKANDEGKKAGLIHSQEDNPYPKWESTLYNRWNEGYLEGSDPNKP